MSEKKYQKVQPIGKIYCGKREYFLFSSHPNVYDTAQSQICKFQVVPNDTINLFGEERLYSYIRSILTAQFQIEYIQCDPINVWDREANND